MTEHVKHIVWAVAAIVIVLGGLAVRGKYEAMVAERMAKRDEQISANQAHTAELQKANKSDENAITARDLQNALNNAKLSQQASQPLSAAQVDAIIAARLAGLNASRGKDAQGNETITVGSGALADRLNKDYIAKQICDNNLGTCEADKANLNQIIGRLTKQTETYAGTIKLQNGQMADMRKSMVPRWTAMFGVGKSQGTNLQDINSYQPALGLNYRFSKQFGVWGMVQNKSAAGGISWNFGGVPK